MEYSKGYNPFLIGEKMMNIVTRKGPRFKERLYLKASSINPINVETDVRVSNYYLGSIVADTIGCNLRCIHCWAIDDVRNITKKKAIGTFYSSEQVAKYLIKESKKNNIKNLRISQGEPTLDMIHLLEILDQLNLSKSVYTFILETNGLIFSKYPEYLKKITEFSSLNKLKNPTIHVRISLKGATPEKFNYLTSAHAKYYEYQIDAIKKCLDFGVDYHPVIMVDFIETQDEMSYLKQRLTEIDKKILMKLEFETLFIDEHIYNRLKKHKVKMISKNILDLGASD